jgi:hypothetical protein
MYYSIKIFLKRDTIVNFPPKCRVTKMKEIGQKKVMMIMMVKKEKRERIIEKKIKLRMSLKLKEKSRVKLYIYKKLIY